MSYRPVKKDSQVWREGATDIKLRNANVIQNNNGLLSPNTKNVVATAVAIALAIFFRSCMTVCYQQPASKLGQDQDPTAAIYSHSKQSSQWQLFESLCRVLNIFFYSAVCWQF